MPYLDATLAFALTMLAVSSLVSYLVKLMRGTAKIRNEVMKKMLKDYYDEEIKPVITREINRLSTDVKKGVSKKLLVETNNYKPNLFTNKEMETLVEATTEEIQERLKRSTLGTQLLTDLGEKADAVFDELGKRYEVVGKKFTESFRDGLKWWTFGVALVLALVINIDSIHIAKTYINNQEARNVVIAQKDAFEQDYNDLLTTIDEEDKDTVTKQELEQAFRDSQEQLNVVTGAGFPIGWSYFPHAYFQGENGTSKDFLVRDNFFGWVTWILGTLLTGMLAGLGAPFWFDVVRGISRTVQSVKGTPKSEG